MRAQIAETRAVAVGDVGSHVHNEAASVSAVMPGLVWTRSNVGRVDDEVPAGRGGGR